MGAGRQPRAGAQGAHAYPGPSILPHSLASPPRPLLPELGSAPCGHYAWPVGASLMAVFPLLGVPRWLRKTKLACKGMPECFSEHHKNETEAVTFPELWNHRSPSWELGWGQTSPGNCPVSAGPAPHPGGVCPWTRDGAGAECGSAAAAAGTAGRGQGRGPQGRGVRGRSPFSLLLPRRVFPAEGQGTGKYSQVGCTAEDLKAITVLLGGAGRSRRNWTGVAAQA